MARASVVEVISDHKHYTTDVDYLLADTNRKWLKLPHIYPRPEKSPYLSVYNTVQKAFLTY
jgi:hypothetical protein